MPQSVTGGDDAASPDVDVPDSDCDAERAGDFSPGKNDPDLRNSETPSVAKYVSAINGEWRHGVDAFMNAARLCADANARLTVAQKLLLIESLPFGQTAFSKFVQIGSDTRLYAPKIQVLLPPHYTTLYAVTLLTDDELKEAIAEKVLIPTQHGPNCRSGTANYREKWISPQGPMKRRSMSSLPSCRLTQHKRPVRFPPP